MRKRVRRRANQFIDAEAEVDEDEEDFDDEDDEVGGEGGFIEREDEAELQRHRDDHRHRELDLQLQAENAQDLQDIAAGFVRRHGRPAGHRTMDSRVVPRKLLVPSVRDPSIWAIKCKPGKEREIMFSLMKKMETMASSKNPLGITAAFERKRGSSTMAGYIYIEARKLGDVMNALQGIQDVYPSSKTLLVPIKEMPDLLHVVKKADITPGTWVRFKRAKYAGDLAQVENVSANGLELRIRMVPRIDYGPGKDSLAVDDSSKRKRPGGKKGMARPPQRLFAEQEVKNGQLLTLPSKSGKKCFQYLGEEYEDGFLMKEVKLSMVTFENVKPSLEEVTSFASSTEDGAEYLDLNALSASLRTGDHSAYQRGDVVEVFEGEQQGLVGRVTAVSRDIVSMDVLSGQLKGTKIEIPFKGLRKKFSPGDHVRVGEGSKYKDELGMVVRIVADKVTIVSDSTMKEITVFSKDLRDAAGSADNLKFSKIYESLKLVRIK